MNDRQIVIRMAGGLANRMFQYSYYMFLKKRGYDVYVDNNYKATKWKMEDIDWTRIFPNAPIRQAPASLIFKYGGGYDLISKIRRHYLARCSSVYEMPNAFYVPDNDILSKYGYLIGIYQSASMVSQIQQDVSSAFDFDPFPDERNKSLEQKMKATNSVAIHVRKGKDYLTRPNYIGTCPLDYYTKAIAYIKERVATPHFYIFTDNPNWVRENFANMDYFLVDINPPIGWGNHFDMQLMSYCKHNIIANSTYSWWGAFLNKNPDKIVIGPKCWFNTEMERYKNLQNKTLVNSWIAL